MNTDDFARFIHLTEQKRELDSQMKEIEAELKPLAIRLPDVLIENEMDSIKMQGNTLHMVTRMSAKPKEGEKGPLLAALKENGFESMFSVYANSLSSLVKEFDESEDGRPQWLDDVIETSQSTKLQMRKS